ncbi:MAG: M56 family metallopeptidase [Pseudobacter sp.]|uniref:M56 family metallopeptidase n=1 Tax=Pseudobacter sp. TaxID=2045420 RepID=UPI003F7DCF5C
MDFICKLSIGLAVTWLFYWLLLRRLTFYRWNRLFLLVYPAMAFLAPMIDISDLLHQGEKPWLKAIPVIERYTFRAEPERDLSWLSLSTIGWLVFAAGALFMIARLGWQYLSLRKAVSGAVLLADDDARLYHVEKAIVPFSFGRSIYLNKHLHTEAELQEILRHEFIHVKQRHSLDMMWGELLCILNWYNPFAWLLRNAIRQNLEFIADHQVLANGVDRKQYQYLLLKVTGIGSFSMANNFNLSSLKKRIIMMNKKTSATVHLLRFMLVVPVLAILLLAFRSVTKQDFPSPMLLLEEGISSDTPKKDMHITLETGDRIKLANGYTVTVDTVPAKRRSPLADSIESMHVYKKDNVNKVEIRLKNGNTETYDLNDPKQKAAFEKKYGKISAPVPPPPPPPPATASPAAAPAPPPPPPPPAKASPATAPAPPAPPKATASKAAAEQHIELVLEDQAVVKSGDATMKADKVVVSDMKSDVKLTLKPTPQGTPLYVIDGEVRPDAKLEAIDPNSIESVSVIKDAAAIAIYGEAARNGVIMVNTKAFAQGKTNVQVNTDAKSDIRFHVEGKNVVLKTTPAVPKNLCEYDALILVNGKEMPCKEAETFLENNKTRIESINIIKGEDKVKEATGKKGKNAILVKMKAS